MRRYLGMPGQTFSDPVSGERVVTLTWDMAEQALDVDAGGTLLTRVTDIATLSTSGMQGYTALGEHLQVRRLPGAAGFNFEVQRNGETLTASFVNFGMAGPSLSGPTAAMDHQKVAPRADGLAFDDQGRLRQNGKIVETDRAIEKGRNSILELIGLSALFGFFQFALTIAFAGSAGLVSVLVPGIVFFIAFAVQSLPYVLARKLVNGQEPKKAGFLLAQVFLWLTYVSLPIIGWFIIYRNHSVLSEARAACP